jgi:hypothetical protein
MRGVVDLEKARLDMAVKRGFRNWASQLGEDFGIKTHLSHISLKSLAFLAFYLFLLDRIRFEYMKRLGWLKGYPGEQFTLVELIIDFDQLAPDLGAKTPELSQGHRAYDRFSRMGAFEREELIRKLIPKAIKEIQDYSTTL